MAHRRSFTEVWNLIRQRHGVESLGAHLEGRYGIGPVTLTQLDGGVYRVEKNDDEPWVARMFPSVRSMDRVDGDARILRLLEKHEFAAERLAHSEPVSRHEGQGVLVTRFVDGYPLSRADEHTFLALGECLGRLHTLPVELATGRRGGAIHSFT